jgi:hypothetical protein
LITFQLLTEILPVWQKFTRIYKLVGGVSQFIKEFPIGFQQLLLLKQALIWQVFRACVTALNQNKVFFFHFKS